MSLSTCSPAELRRRVEVAFKEIDTDNNGYIEAAEVVNVLKAIFNDPSYKGEKMDIQDIKQMATGIIMTFDKNNDSKISIDEFADFLKKVLEETG
jgi:Ca2+-binding EF-hand superfamily protein